MDLAPIALSTYRRPDHLARAISALQKNVLAQRSDLFVFSDAPKVGDELAVAQVRQIASNIRGFRNVQVTNRLVNGRIENNRGGIQELLKTYGRCIFLEEDVVVAPNFLGFMNRGLDYFQGTKKIFAICGYTPPVDFGKSYSLNSYLCSRFSAWGFGIWADRYKKIELGSIATNLLNVLQLRRLRGAGTDLVNMVGQMTRGEIEALDVRINYTMAKNKSYVVCPTLSLTTNKGHDGTGVHCGDTDYFDTSLDMRADVDWNFGACVRSQMVDKKLFFYRSRHVQGRRNRILYHLTRKF